MASIQKELMEADKCSHVAQAKAWEKFNLYNEFPSVEGSVFEGWHAERYLDWETIDMELHIKPYFSFIKYLKTIFLHLIGAKKEKMPAIEYKITNVNDVKSIKIKIRFKKTEGKITSTYSSN